MALAASSICLYGNERIGNPCSRTGFAITEKSQNRRMVYYRGIVTLKIKSNGKKSTCSQLMRSYRNCCKIGLRCSNLVSGRTEKVSSISNTGTTIPEVALLS